MSVSNQVSNPHANSSFRQTLTLLFSAFLAAVLAQNLFDFGVSRHSPWLACTALGLVGVLWVMAFWRKAIRQFSSPHFSTSILLGIAVGTAVGTFVIQNASPQIFTARYGELGSGILRTLYFHEVFHSWWYVAFFILLLVSLLQVGFKRNWNLKNIGFIAVHLSPVIIVAGFWIDYFYGFRGFVGLEKGQEKDQIQVYQANTSIQKGHKQLPFAIRLNEFSSERFAPDYKLQIWKLPEGNSVNQAHALQFVGNQIPDLIATLPLEKDRIRHIYGTDIYYRVREIYPDFEFKYSYPERIDTIFPVDPGIMLELKTPAGEPVLQLRAEENHAILEPHFGATIEFYWDVPEDIRTLVQSAQGLSSDSRIEKIVITGSDQIVYYLGEKGIEGKRLERGRFYPIPGKENMGFTYTFVFPDPGYMKAAPSTRSTDWINPVAKLEVWGKEWQQSTEAFVYPGLTNRGGYYMVPGTEYMLGIGSTRDMQHKFWRSSLTMVEDDREIGPFEIEVNVPLYYRGYRFYQSDYDENNPEYSGIGISYTPGLRVVYSGFILLFLSTCWMFYFRAMVNKSKES